MTNRIAELIGQAVSRLRDALSDDEIAGLPDADRAEVFAAVGEALRLSEAAAIEMLASADTGFERRFASRSQNELVRRALRVDAAQATRFGKAEQAVRRPMNMTSGERMPARWPALREALLDGVIGMSGLLAATTPLEEAGHRIGTTERLLADADLAAFARGISNAADGAADDGGEDAVDGDEAVGAEPAATPEDLKQHAYAWAMALDPDGAEPTDRGAQTRRSLSVGPLKDGFHRLQGSLLPDVAAQLLLILDAYNNPKTGGAPIPEGVVFRDSAEPAAEGGDPFNSDERKVIDPRTAAQKRHDAFAAALGIAVRHDDMPKLGGAAPTLVVQVDLAGYASGSGWATIARTLAPVPFSVADHVGCTGGIQRVLFEDGRIVGIGVSDRVFTAHQRRAIVLRDKECLIPGCHVPATWCEIHHVQEHQNGGPTHTDNGTRPKPVLVSLTPWPCHNRRREYLSRMTRAYGHSVGRVGRPGGGKGIGCTSDFPVRRWQVFL